MRIHISTAPARPKPQVGDRKFIRGVEHVRRQETVKSGPYRGASIYRHGLPVFEWVPVSEAPVWLLRIEGRLVGQRPGYKVPAKEPRPGDASRD